MIVYSYFVKLHSLHVDERNLKLQEKHTTGGENTSVYEVPGDLTTLRSPARGERESERALWCGLSEVLRYCPRARTL